MHAYSRLGVAAGVVALYGLLIQEAWAAVPAGPSDVYVQGTQLMVRKRNTNGSLGMAQPYIIKGVTWSPATRAPATGPNPSNPGETVPYGFFFDWPNRNPQGHVVLRFWLREEVEARYLIDLASIASMSANTVRLYDEPNSDAPVSRKILDKCYLRGIMVIMTVAVSKEDLDNGRHLVVVDRYKDHPAILMWALGNEWNFNRYYGYTTMAEAIAATNNAAVQMRSRDPNHPVSSVLGDRFSAEPPVCDPSDPCCSPPPSDYAQTAIPFIVSAAADIDLWGLNIYRGGGFGELFSQWQAVTTTKPLYVSEFGADSFRTQGYRVVSCNQADDVTGLEDQAQQATVVRGLWNEMIPHLSALNPSVTCVGGFVHEFNDELWKVGSYHTGLGGLVDYDGPDNVSGTPDDDTSYDEYNAEGFTVFSGFDNVLNEEYFGLVSADRSPKQAFADLQQFYFSFPNLLQNPGFEQDKQNWSFPSNASIDATVFQSGTTSAKLVNAGTISSTPRIVVTAGASYRVAGWVKTQSITNPLITSYGAQIRIQWYNASGGLISSPTLVSGLKRTRNWTRYAKTLTAPTSAASARLQLQITGSGTTGTAWFDTLSISP